MRRILYIFPVLLFIHLTALCVDYAYSNTPAAVGPSIKLDQLPQHKLSLATETHLPLRLKPRKYQVVTLDKEVGEATVDDQPDHVTAVIYDSKSVALVPHSDGASHVTIKGKNGETLMARYIVVADPAQKYIRVHLACAAKDASCDKERVYYCPNLCYETRVMGNVTASSTPLKSKAK